MRPYPMEEERIDEALWSLVQQAVVEHNMPSIGIAPSYGQFLTLLVAMCGARRILELGTLAGYSAMCLARGKRDCMVTTIELQPAFATVATQTIAKGGYAHRITVLQGEALPHMASFVKAGSTFDFFFIDADKGNYPQYLEYAIELGTPGAIIVADNVFSKGRTQQVAYTSPSVQALRQFLVQLQTDPRLDSTIVPAYDGLAIARLRE